MGFFKWLFDIGSAFSATCPKCGTTVDWPACSNCGHDRFGTDGFTVGESHLRCKNCRQRYSSCDCPYCGCTIKGTFFFRTERSPRPVQVAVAARPTMPAEPQHAHSHSAARPAPSPLPDVPEPAAPEIETPTLEAGLECLKKNKFDEAISLLTRVIQLQPRNIQAYLARACAHDTLAVEAGPHQDAHVAQALADLSEAIRLDPTFSRAYEERGRLYLGLDEEDKGIADLKEAIRLDPANRNAKCRLAEHYVDLADALVEVDGQPDKALTLYNAALDLDPGKGDGGFGPEFFGWRGTAYLRNGQIREAIKDFIQGIKRSGDMDGVVCSPSNEEEQEALTEATIHKEKGDAHWARQEYEEAYEAYGGPGGEYEGAIGYEPGFTRAIVENMEATLRVLEEGTDIGTMLDEPTTHAAALHAHMHGLKGQRDHKDWLAFKMTMYAYRSEGDHEQHQTMQRIWKSLGH